MSQPAQLRLFKYRHFEPEIILLCLRWYLRYSLSYRDLEEMMAQRGLWVDHTTIYRWVQHYAPILEKKCRVRLRPTNDSWHVDETYVKVKGTWMYLYRAVDSDGNTVEFMLSPTRDGQAAKRFFRKALRGRHTVPPRVINVDRNPCTGYVAHPYRIDIADTDVASTAPWTNQGDRAAGTPCSGSLPGARITDVPDDPDRVARIPSHPSVVQAQQKRSHPKDTAC